MYTNLEAHMSQYYSHAEDLLIYCINWHVLNFYFSGLEPTSHRPKPIFDILHIYKGKTHHVQNQTLLLICYIVIISNVTQNTR